MLSILKPYLRVSHRSVIRWKADRDARRTTLIDADSARLPPGFIVACGRSGTTVLGELLGAHPEVLYHAEPYHLWAAIDRRTDVTNLHQRVGGLFFMDGSHATPEARVRFNRLIVAPCARLGRRLVIEKTPHNICRIGFLESLIGAGPMGSPSVSRRVQRGAKYVHIVRSGLDVVRSIGRIAAINDHKLPGLDDMNRWWGRGYSKWASLAREGIARGYFPDEVGRLSSHAQRGAYEWLVSLGEADRWRSMLDERLLEISYPQLAAQTGATLRALCGFFGVGAPDEWLAKAGSIMEPERKNSGGTLLLPPRMRAAFNGYMDRYGFDGRAEILG